MSAPPTPSIPVPTIDDLKVKLCYICHEEEKYEDPPKMPEKKWTHPCKCTLVAHEECLLEWIQSSQLSPSRASKALECVQCGSKYRLESERPLLLKITSTGSRWVKKAGAWGFVGGIAALIGTYAILAGYGLWATRQFLGKGMYDLYLGNSPLAWPLLSYTRLPMIPCVLLISQIPYLNRHFPGAPLVLILPATYSSRNIENYWNLPENIQRISKGLISASPAAMWPPKPLFIGIVGIPVTRNLYQRLYRFVYTKITGFPPLDLMATLIELAAGNLRREGAIFPRGRNAENIAALNVNDAEENVGAVPVPGLQNPRRVAGAPVANEPAAPDPPVVAPAGPPRVGNLNLIELCFSEVGYKVYGALIAPVIASVMGSLLLNLSAYSSIVYCFLAVKDPVGGVWVPLPSSKSNPPLKFSDNPALFVEGFNTILGTDVSANGRSDPVWWRNLVGLAIFIVLKDCVRLVHIHYTLREIASRKVVNRDFQGVNIESSELVPEFLAKLKR